MAMMTECRPVPHHRDQNDRQEDRRKGHPDIDQPGDDGIHPAADITGEQAEDGAKQAGRRGSGDGDEQGDPRAVDQPGQNIPAQIVGAEQVAGLRFLVPERRDVLQHEILLERVVRREERREDRGEREQQQHAAAQDDPPVHRHAADCIVARTRGGRAEDCHRLSHGASAG